MEPSVVRAKTGEPRQPVRGRDDDLVTIGRPLERLLSGIGWVIVVEGAAGLGKSRLLNEAVTMARRLSIRVGNGAADPGDNVVQLAPLMEALFGGREPILERAALTSSARKWASRRPFQARFSVANSVANPKEYLRPNGRVTNTWKAKIAC
jgi:predicted ATPase